MRYISIDPATKSIAVSCINANKGFDPYDETTYNKCHIEHIWAEDLAPGKNSDNIDPLTRTRLVKRFVTEKVVPYITDKDETTILIEEQIHTTKTYVSYVTLLACLSDYNVVIMKPALKNQLTIGGHKIGDYYKKHRLAYDANKEHSAGMFEYFLDKYLTCNGLKASTLPYNKKYRRDIADTFTQMFHYHISHNK